MAKQQKLYKNEGCMKMAGPQHTAAKIDRIADTTRPRRFLLDRDHLTTARLVWLGAESERDSQEHAARCCEAKRTCGANE
mmetsp:Transcript_36568/g.78011  ORF Transcript_36568/g.78011 Transcript_36568/m.78011 type:complete len:80 (+) Transcript_36568:1-240(+)